MQFRFPQPLLGWRKFFGDVGIIVLGVLIALGAGQLVERWQWRQQVKQADEVFLDEMNSATLNAYMQLAIEPCLKDRLTDIVVKLNEPAGPWRGMAQQLNWRDADVPPPTTPIPFEGSSGFSLITTDGWSNAVANGTVNQLPFRRGLMLSRAYTAARQLSDDQREERVAVAKLRPLGTDRILSAESRLLMLQNLSEIRRTIGAIHSDSIQILLNAKQAGLGFTDKTLHSGEAGNIEYLFDLERRLRGSCVTKPDLP